MMKPLKALSLILVLALMLSVGAYAAAEAPAPASSEPSGEPSGEAKSVEEAYVDYIRDWLQNELLHNDQMTQEQIDNEYMPLIEAGDYETFPACYIYNGWLETGTAMTFEEFAAQYQPTESKSSGEINEEDVQTAIDLILPEISAFADQVDEYIQSSDGQEAIDMLSGILGILFSGETDEWDDDDYSMEVPPRVASMSEEENILLNGDLKDGVYTNDYFGLKLSVPKGGTLVRTNDDATESSEIIPLSKTFEEGWGGLFFTAEAEGIDGFVNVFISALDDDELGLSEEELVKLNIDEIWKINALFDEDRGPELGTALLAGEEHPMAFQTSETIYGETLYVDFYIPKGDFMCWISIYANDAKLEDFTTWFEKI